MSGRSYGTMRAAPSFQWPEKEPDSYVDYTWDARKALTNAHACSVDSLVSVSLAIKPSGTGELSYSRLLVDPTASLITVWLSGGVPGRSYLVNIEAATEGGRLFQWPIGIEVDRRFAKYPLPAPPSAGYGPPLTWSFMPGFDLTNPLNSGYTLLLAGF